MGARWNVERRSKPVFLYDSFLRSFHFCSYCSTASSYNGIGLMDRDTFTEGFRRPSETFGSRSIFLAHDYAGSKFDKRPISIDFTGYKTQTNLLFRAFLTSNLVVRLFVSNT